MQDNGGLNGEVMRLGDAIVTIVREEFERTQRVILLSNLGQDLRKAGVDYRAILGERKFADFIRKELVDRVTLIPIPGKDKAIGIHPAGVDLSTRQNPFGPHPLAAQNAPIGGPVQDKRPLLNSQVWFAFSHFLADGDVRILELLPEPLYRDVPSDADVPQGSHRIDRNLIVPVGTMPKTERDVRIYENIEQWAEKAGVPLDGLLAKKPERNDRRNLLDELIRTLGPADLQRVTLPLDIVKTLRDRRL